MRGGSSATRYEGLFPQVPPDAQTIVADGAGLDEQDALYLAVSEPKLAEDDECGVAQGE